MNLQRWNHMVLSVWLTAWLGLSPAACRSAVPEPPGGRLDEAVIVSVIDGDTVEIELDGRAYRVRLLGIDTPESVHPEVPEQCYGKEASEALAQLLPSGTVVSIERDVEAHDHYGRLLLYLTRQSDGLFINLWLVREGLAEAVFYAPNLHYRPVLQRARQQARVEGRGLWGSCDGPDQPLR